MSIEGRVDPLSSSTISSGRTKILYCFKAYWAVTSFLNSLVPLAKKTGWKCVSHSLIFFPFYSRSYLFSKKSRSIKIWVLPVRAGTESRLLQL